MSFVPQYPDSSDIDDEEKGGKEKKGGCDNPVTRRSLRGYK